MQTIHGAAEAVSGKATWLVPGKGECPFSVPPKLQAYDCREYRGYYHPDLTVPSDYFKPDVERPARVNSLALDFTYLSEGHADNPAHNTMATGVRVRTAFDDISATTPEKRWLFEPVEVSVHESARLRAAMEQRALGAT
jgi:hypothetical protein